MKTVIMVAIISVISYQASAQEEVKTDAVKIGSAVVQPAPKSLAAKSKKRQAVKSKPEKKAEEESTTLVTESSHKAKSTFQEMLEKRIKIDAENSEEEIRTERRKRSQ